MSVGPNPRYSAVYDLDRLEFIRAARVPFAPLPPIVFEKGPLVGVTPEAATVLPDLFEVDEPAGRYLPTLAVMRTGIYVWRPR